jgi:hypothetical protein
VGELASIFLPNKKPHLEHRSDVAAFELRENLPNL